MEPTSRDTVDPKISESVRVLGLALGPLERLQMGLVQGQKLPLVGVFIRMFLKWRGVQIPPQTFTRRPWLPHIGPIVVHERTRFGADVHLYHGVTIGRRDVWRAADPGFESIEIGDGAMLCAGATILGGHGVLSVGRGTVIGANAVLTRSTGEFEIWAGNPARKVGDR